MRGRVRHRRRPPDALALVAARFRVLGEPLRLGILQVLAEGERTVTDLAAEVGTTQPNVSKHLRLLEEAGLVRRRPRGTAVLCAIADATVFDLCDTVCHSLARRLRDQSSALEPRGKGAPVARPWGRPRARWP